MGTQFRKIGTTVLAAAIAVALSAPMALAQDASHAPDAAPVPSPFHINATFVPDAANGPDALNSDQASQAQSSHHEGFGFGILGGFLFKSLSQSPVDGEALTANTGKAIGIFFGGNRPGRVGVEGQLMYNIRKGTTLNGDTLSIHSLEIPVLIRVNVGSQSLKGVLGYIIVGPAADIQLNAALLSQSVNKNYKGLNINLMFGGGIEITRFFIELREDIGLFSVNSGNLGSTTAIHDKTFEFLFGFRIN
jgi:Outer membrane protein beta-barrel domain